MIVTLSLVPMRSSGSDSDSGTGGCSKAMSVMAAILVAIEFLWG